MSLSTPADRPSGMLTQFIQAKEEEVAVLRRHSAQGRLGKICPQRSPSLRSTLLGQGPGAVIAEYKPASPSKGPIAPDLTAREAGRLFMQGGASAISVLTDSRFFGSSLQALEDLAKTRLPLLRKDFIIHPLQVQETASTPASAFLLITRLFEHDSLLQDTYAAGMSVGLEPVVEVFDHQDVLRAKKLGAEIFLVNSRDLDSLHLNLDIHHALIQDKEDDELWICASGLDTGRQVQAMADLGYGACLIGTSIMHSPDRLRALQALTAQGLGT